jgi:4-hydroxybenzoate polyprenyltransferase/phosphoserine phosphatase
MTTRNESAALVSTATVPLVVDLDGTLLKTDTLIESALALAHRDPRALLRVAASLRSGRAALKAELASRAPLDPAVLPYDEQVLAHLRHERDSGRSLVLATAADERIATAIAAHLGLFDHVIASDGRRNLRGRAKLAALQARFPEGFDYAGNSRDDLVVLRAARQALVVRAPRTVVRAARRAGNVHRTFPRPAVELRLMARILRIHQWSKNALVFLPLLLAHRLQEPATLIAGALAFVAFGLVASSAYVLNDLVDLDADRRHPRKVARPFASGRVSIGAGLLLSPALLAGGAACAALLPREFALLLAGYCAATLAYSFGLKRMVGLDAVLLAGLYTVRIFAGGSATGIPVSVWLASFSGFVFLSLALLKRTTELVSAERKLPGRGYVPGDVDAALSMGTASAYISVLVLALYISSDDVARLYTHPERLWLVCPLVLYWLTRAWFLGRRGSVQDDPVLFALKDPVSWIVCALSALVVAWAS